MIRSVAVVHRARAEAWPRATAVALIVIDTPGCAVAARPGPHALHLSFDTVAGELEAASLRLPQAASAVPFAVEHAHAVSTFVAKLQHERECIDLWVCESDGYSRSVTVARWAAQRLGCPLHEPAPVAAVAPCALMGSVLRGVTGPVQPVTRRAVQVAEPEFQP